MKKNKTFFYIDRFSRGILFESTFSLILDYKKKFSAQMFRVELQIESK